MMDTQQKKKIIGQTNDACNNMIMNIRQLRISVLELFNTLADTGVDPEKTHHHPQTAQNHHHHHPQHHHHHHHQHQADKNSTSTGKLYNQQTIASLTNSHTLCTASNPPPRIQRQLELQQQQDLVQFVDQSISSIASTIRNLEQDIAVLMQNQSVINAGETVHVASESSLDKHNLYIELCSSYKTISRLHDYSTTCHALLLQQSLRRKNKRSDAANTNHAPSTLPQNAQSQSTQPSQSSLASARSESIVATFNPYIYKISTSKQSITTYLDAYLKLCEHMEGTYSQPFGISTGVLQVSVKTVLKAILVMRGIVIDAVIVKAYHESFANKSSSGPHDLTSGLMPSAVGGPSPFVDTDLHDIDLWSESKYNVFRRLTHHANAAVLHFQYPLYPEIAVRSFLSWFNSYSDLFSAICSRCNQRLRKFMPPICRDFSAGFHAHHDSCK